MLFSLMVAATLKGVSLVVTFALTKGFPQALLTSIEGERNPTTFLCAGPKPGTCSPVVVVVLLVIFCYMFTIFDCRVLCIVSQFVFWVLLQLPLWYGSGSLLKAIIGPVEV